MVLQAPTLDFCLSKSALFSFGHMETTSQRVSCFLFIVWDMFCVMLMLYTFQLAWNSYF